jgi:hypothetical protein
MRTRSPAAQEASLAPYFVTVRRRSISPLQTRLLVRARSGAAAGELAAYIAEERRGGIFEATKIRRAARDPSAYPSPAYDDGGWC